MLLIKIRTPTLLSMCFTCYETSPDLLLFECCEAHLKAAQYFVAFGAGVSDWCCTLIFMLEQQFLWLFQCKIDFFFCLTVGLLPTQQSTTWSGERDGICEGFIFMKLSWWHQRPESIQKGSYRRHGNVSKIPDPTRLVQGSANYCNNHYSRWSAHSLCHQMIFLMNERLK